MLKINSKFRLTTMALAIIGLGSPAVSYAGAGTLQFSAANFTINEGGSDAGLVATFLVTRTGGSDGAVSVDYATSDGTATAGSDYTAKSDTLNWADGDSASKFAQVTITDDNDNNEGDETFNITLSNPTGGASLGTPNPATMTIEDNCGPGAHWIDSDISTLVCPAGTDILTNTEATLKVDTNLGDGCDPSGETAVVLYGPAEIDRQAGTDIPDHHIVTEMVSMVLTGGGLTLRAGVNEGLTLASDGKITEQAGDNTQADSYFDIYFEIDLPGPETWHNIDGDPMHVETVIDKVPPFNSSYQYPAGPYIYLYDATETQVGCLSHAVHDVPPPTLVTLINNSFTATASNGAVTIGWETASEIDNAGFFVWKGQLKADKTECSRHGEDYTEVKRISPFILAQESGTSYSYSDSQVASGNTYCYALEDVDLMDKHTFHLDDITSATVQ